MMNWLANEVGIGEEQLQLYIGFLSNATTFSMDIHPCDMCARLQNSAITLMDIDGAYIAALAAVVNEFITPGVPPSEEQMTLIATALVNPEEGTSYALAAEWFDALAEYIGILNNEMIFSTEESLAFADKYTASVTGGDDPAVAAYIAAQLAALSGG